MVAPKCACGKPAWWVYSPDGDWYRCDDCARKPCSCNMVPKPGCEPRYDEETGAQLYEPVDSDLILEKDWDGRDLVCCEFDYLHREELGWFASKWWVLKLRAWSVFARSPARWLVEGLETDDKNHTVAKTILTVIQHSEGRLREGERLFWVERADLALFARELGWWSKQAFLAFYYSGGGR